MSTERIGLLTFVLVLTLFFTEASQSQSSLPVDDTAADLSDLFGTPSVQPQILRDGEIEARLESSTHTARVAEPIEIRLVVDAPEGTQLAMPVIGNSLGKFEVIDSRSIEALPMDGDPARRRWTYIVTVEAIDSGELAVPSLEILYRTPNDPAARSTQKSLRSEPFLIEIASLLSEDQDPKAFRGIKELVHTTDVETAGDSKTWIGLGTVSAVIALLVGLRWWRRDRSPKPFPWACDEIGRIESLSAQQAISTGDTYAELTRILKVFLEQDLGIPATAMSSGELQEELVSRSFPAAIMARLTQFLAEADEVKFSGRSRPRLSLTESPASCVREIVDQVQEMSITRSRGG